MKEVALSLREVCFSYRESSVLDRVTLEVAAGEFLAIVGPNGGGKTTLLKLIMGFLRPSRGSIDVFGLPPRAAQSLISYVPQTMQYDRHFPISVLEVVLSGRLSRLPWHGRYAAEDKLKALEALQQVGLEGQAQQPFGALSGGQTQRVLLARALVSEPRLLLLDEPTANVDPGAEREISSLLESWKSRMTILMVTHNLTPHLSQTDRVVCIQHQLFSLQPQEVCQHFAYGLYHPPLVQASVASQRLSR